MLIMRLISIGFLLGIGIYLGFIFIRIILSLFNDKRKMR